MEWLISPLKSNFTLCVLFVILVNNVGAHKGCLEEERNGLLKFKEFYNGTLDFPEWDVNNDCCQWESVVCNKITGHVTEISFPIALDSWSMNLSLFAPFKKLQRLDLSAKSINGFAETERDLASFHHLEILDLRENDFDGGIPSFIWALSSLKALSLANNEFNGSLPIQAFCKMKNLQELDLNSNNLEGTLPPCLTDLTSLRLLDLSVNRFNGKVSSSLIASLTSLEYIDLSYNRFEGLFSFSSFANLSKLEVVQFMNDNIKFEVETESADWIPRFQLKNLVLINCNLNNPSGEIPKFLLHQHNLSVLDLSGNKLDGNFPYWLLENNTELQVLNLQRNSFSGPFHPPFSNISVGWIDISDNNFSGQIPENIGEVFPGLTYLNLSRNAFGNGVPSSIGNISNLMYLDLSGNDLSGEFPTHVVTGCEVLTYLILSDNIFHGELPSPCNSSLWFVKMDNNQFTGKISNGLAACNLGWLDLSNNHLSGEIPSWFRNYTDLQTLLLQNNLFKGQVPSILASDFFDASQNSLSGSLPSFTEETSFLGSLHLQGNRFTGSIPKSYVNLSGLLTLDLSDNNLSGRIPNFIDALSDLRILLLGENYFSGSIPNQLCQMRNISLLDLSRNSLSGSIPDCLPNISGPTSLSFMPESSDGVVPKCYRYQSILEKNYDYGSLDFLFEQDEANFVTKNRSGSYKGGILDYMSGLDLSCNNLTGQIPSELGMLVQVRALNLSHNQLTGHIPKLFSHLKQVESLDLSFNRLSGEIPSELIDLNFLEVFIVAHNNLSGRVPEMKGQFGTFPKSNFEGNQFLCGPQLEKNCTTLVASTLPNASSSDESEDKWYDIDLLFFSASFVGTYFVFLLAVVTLLYMNPRWRRWWFNLTEECMYSCYYFLCDSLRSLSAHL